MASLDCECCIMWHVIEAERYISTATVVCSGGYLWYVFPAFHTSCKRMTLLRLTTVGVRSVHKKNYTMSLKTQAFEHCFSMAVVGLLMDM